MSAPAPRARRTHLEAAVGVNAWLAGIAASPSLAVSASAGYALVQRGRVELRLGGALAYSWLRDLTGTDHFVSLLVDPSLRIRLFRERLYLRAGVPLGVLLVSGVARGSALLTSSSAGGVVAGFELRPSLGIEVAALPWLRVAAAVEAGISPRSDDRLAAPLLVRLVAALSLSFLL